MLIHFFLLLIVVYQQDLTFTTDVNKKYLTQQYIWWFTNYYRTNVKNGVLDILPEKNELMTIGRGLLSVFAKLTHIKTTRCQTYCIVNSSVHWRSRHTALLFESWKESVCSILFDNLGCYACAIYYMGHSLFNTEQNQTRGPAGWRTWCLGWNYLPVL